MLHFNTWGGGGWGDPLKREAEKVAADVARGPRQRGGRGALRRRRPTRTAGSTQAATEKLRRDMAGARGRTALFDRGFKSIAELRTRCLAETGFEPPKEPRFAITYAPRRNRSGQDEQRANRSPGRQLCARRLSRVAGLGRRPALILIDFAQAYYDPAAPLFGGDGCKTALKSALRLRETRAPAACR